MNLDTKLSVLVNIVLIGCALLLFSRTRTLLSRTTPAADCRPSHGGPSWNDLLSTIPARSNVAGASPRPAPPPRAMTKDAKVHLNISRMIQSDAAFHAANPALTLSDFLASRTPYSSIVIPDGSPLMESYDPSCGGAPDPRSPTLAFRPYNVKGHETIQSLIDSAEADPCIKGVYSSVSLAEARAAGTSAGGPMPSEEKRTVAAVLPLDDRVKALAKSDILQQAAKEGGRPELSVATIRVTGQTPDTADEAPGIPKPAKEMQVRNPLAEKSPEQPPTVTITVSRTEFPVSAKAGPAQLVQLNNAIVSAVNGGARLISVPGIEPDAIQAAVEYAAAHGAQVVTLGTHSPRS